MQDGEDYLKKHQIEEHLQDAMAILDKSRPAVPTVQQSNSWLTAKDWKQILILFSPDFPTDIVDYIFTIARGLDWIQPPSLFSGKPTDVCDEEVCQAFESAVRALTFQLKIQEEKFSVEEEDSSPSALCCERMLPLLALFICFPRFMYSVCRIFEYVHDQSFHSSVEIEDDSECDPHILVSSKWCLELLKKESIVDHLTSFLSLHVLTDDISRREGILHRRSSSSSSERSDTLFINHYMSLSKGGISEEDLPSSSSVFRALELSSVLQDSGTSIFLSIVLILGIVFAISGSAATTAYYLNLDNYAVSIGASHTVAEMQTTFTGGYVIANYITDSYDGTYLKAYANDFTWSTMQCDEKMSQKDIDELTIRGVTFPLVSPYGIASFDPYGYATLTNDVSLTSNTVMKYSISNGITSQSFTDIQIDRDYYNVDYSNYTNDPCFSSFYDAACGGAYDSYNYQYEYTCWSYDVQDTVVFAIDVNDTNTSFYPSTSKMTIPSSYTFTYDISNSYINTDYPLDASCGVLDTLPDVLDIEIWAKDDPCAIFAVDYGYDFGSDSSVFTMVGWVMVGIGGGGILVVILALCCCISAGKPKKSIPAPAPAPMPAMMTSPLQAQPSMMQPGMMQPGMQPGMMQPGMQPGMMQPGMQPGMMQPGMQPDYSQPMMSQPAQQVNLAPFRIESIKGADSARIQKIIFLDDPSCGTMTKKGKHCCAGTFLIIFWLLFSSLGISLYTVANRRRKVYLENVEEYAQILSERALLGVYSTLDFNDVIYPLELSLTAANPYSFDSNFSPIYGSDLASGTSTFECSSDFTDKDVDKLKKQGVVFPVKGMKTSTNFASSGLSVSFSGANGLENGLKLNFSVSDAGTGYSNTLSQLMLQRHEYSDDVTIPRYICESKVYETQCYSSFDLTSFEFSCISYQYPSHVALFLDPNDSFTGFSNSSIEIQHDSNLIADDMYNPGYLSFNTGCGAIAEVPLDNINLDVYLKNDPCGIYFNKYGGNLCPEEYSTMLIFGIIFIVLAALFTIFLIIFCSKACKDSSNNVSSVKPPQGPVMIAPQQFYPGTAPPMLPSQPTISRYPVMQPMQSATMVPPTMQPMPLSPPPPLPQYPPQHPPMMQPQYMPQSGYSQQSGSDNMYFM
ncbi:hypothetical protein ADUPG1_000326 [Aduncisulcus paluster]|uniref:Uncharacterized protein n=1 Tax=Aduncisulcus paluster TaxID=2918883 RepID=A0ABQ5K7P2_9EUKA|nr:hypothetical protein ADUPG1_000326 [Aduncisulcus paluster]